MTGEPSTDALLRQLADAKAAGDWLLVERIEGELEHHDPAALDAPFWDGLAAMVREMHAKAVAP